LIFSTTLRTNQRDIIVNVHNLRVKCPLFLSDFNKSWSPFIYFRKILEYQISSKFFQDEPSCSLRMDRQTGMTELIIAFRNFANAPKACAVLAPQYKLIINGSSQLFVCLCVSLALQPTVVVFHTAR
jgi:hypothetical protein